MLIAIYLSDGNLKPGCLLGINGFLLILKYVCVYVYSLLFGHPFLMVLQRTPYFRSVCLHFDIYIYSFSRSRLLFHLHIHMRIVQMGSIPLLKSQTLSSWYSLTPDSTGFLLMNVIISKFLDHTLCISAASF